MCPLKDERNQKSNNKLPGEYYNLNQAETCVLDFYCICDMIDRGGANCHFKRLKFFTEFKQSQHTEFGEEISQSKFPWTRIRVVVRQCLTIWYQQARVHRPTYQGYQSHEIRNKDCHDAKEFSLWHYDNIVPLDWQQANELSAQF